MLFSIFVRFSDIVSDTIHYFLQYHESLSIDSYIDLAPALKDDWKSKILYFFLQFQYFLISTEEIYNKINFFS